MSTTEPQQQYPCLWPERVAYWYFRLNGFLLLENFIVHDVRTGGQKTDIDLIGIRFRNRRELFCDDTEMKDDKENLEFSDDVDEIVIVEVKTNQSCTFNLSWVEEKKKNIQRIISAIGCVPKEKIDDVAESIYKSGFFKDDIFRIRIVAIGRSINEGLRHQLPKALQMTWNDVLGFMWERFRKHKKHKRSLDQWRQDGKDLLNLFERNEVSKENFISSGLAAMLVGDP